jgi:hypothetical protein
MARYIQKIQLVGKERWIGWEVDGIGTETFGLTLADEIPDEELRRRGVKEFRTLPFETFVEMSALSAPPTPTSAPALVDEDVEFRLDALQVGMEQIRGRGVAEVPRSVLTAIFAEQQLDDPRVQRRLAEWQRAGRIVLVGGDDCYLRITGRLA